MQVVLVMFRPQGDRRSFSITREMTVIGRREDCDFRIPLGEISRKHCRLIRDDDGLRVEDLGSSNGTYHNGQRVQEAVLQPGDTLQVGSVVFVLQIDGVPADDELEPMAATGTSREAHSVETAPMGDADEGIASGNGEFDPMTVLEGGDSAVGHEAVTLDPDESALGRSSMAIDLEESSHGESKF